MRVIGTAGHVDHGKSALVEALTGTHPDRLKEEQEREMTIDLGFAWFTLPGGLEVGVIDVPGHRDFIENMLAGVGGIDAALFVVAADEGVMPQTREHLAILDLLQVHSGVVALTKSDLVEDPDWLELVAADIRQVLAPTGLAEAPILPVSARTGAGLDQLTQSLSECLVASPSRADLGRPRLPVDRVFSMAGFGTVATGTAVDGSFALGDEVTLYPTDRTARIRGLQTHRRKLERSAPGSRVAVNLSGVDIQEVRRGMVAAPPGSLASSTLLDVQFRHLSDAGGALKNNAEVKLFVGAAEVLASVRLLQGKELPPGAVGWMQLELAHPLAVRRGDRFILRRPSPGATVGGGVILDPQPRRRYRPKQAAAAVARLEALARGSPAELLFGALEALGPGPLAEAIARAGLEEASAAEAVAELAAGGQLVLLEPDAASTSKSKATVASRGRWLRLLEAVREALATYHAAQPLRAGMPREELKSRLGLPSKILSAVVAYAAAQGEIVEQGPVVRLPSHQVRLSASEQARVDATLAQFRRDPFNPPSVKEVREQLGEEVLAVLLDRGELVQVSSEVLFLRETYEQMVEAVKARLAAGGTLTVAQVRDMFNNSRKYALALMEHLDALGVTVRVGDERKLK